MQTELAQVGKLKVSFCVNKIFRQVLKRYPHYQYLLTSFEPFRANPFFFCSIRIKYLLSSN